MQDPCFDLGGLPSYVAAEALGGGHVSVFGTEQVVPKGVWLRQTNLDRPEACLELRGYLFYRKGKGLDVIFSVQVRPL